MTSNSITLFCPMNMLDIRIICINVLGSCHCKQQQYYAMRLVVISFTQLTRHYKTIGLIQYACNLYLSAKTITMHQHMNLLKYETEANVLNGNDLLN